jgi:hypothetical protein
MDATMKIALSLIALLALTTTARADEPPGPVLGESYAVPPPVYPPLMPRRGNSFRIISGASVNDGNSSAGYVVDGVYGPVFESYHAESSNPWADMPPQRPYLNTGMYGPMMFDVLLFSDISSRF